MSAIGWTVSKLNRRFRAALISFTPRSRVFAVAITLNPAMANRLRLSSGSSGTAITRSLRTDRSTSCISSGQRVNSSNRTTLPSRIPRNSGAGTSDRSLGPSARSSA